MFEDRLEHAIALCKSGEIFEARKILREIVDADPKNDSAWTWLANTYTKSLDRIAVLNEWLKSNPESVSARDLAAAYMIEPRKVEGAEERVPDKQSRKVEGSEESVPDKQSNEVINFQGSETIPVLVRRSDQIRNKRKSNSTKRPFLIPALAVGLLILVGLVLLGTAKFHKQEPPSSPMIVISPSPSTTFFSTPSSIPSLTSTPFFSPTAPPSSTPLPSNTPLPSSTPTLTATPIEIPASINIDRAYLYAGPSAKHEIVQCQVGNCIYTRGTQVTLLEKHKVYSETWFLVKTPDGKYGWLLEDWLLIKGDQNKLPTAAAIPTYPPPPTP